MIELARTENRPALPRIGYRIGAYTDFREQLIRHVNAAPELTHWTHREPDDPGIALLECGAVLGDILTFYQELYANEAYLRTASWRSSVAELARLVGYRLAPGLGGSATFAFELRPGAPVTVPAGFSLQVELADGDAPAVLQTKAELVAVPELSRFSLHRPLRAPPLLRGARSLWLGGAVPADLAADDRLLLAVPDGADPARLTATQIVVVDAISALHGAAIVEIKGSLQRDYPAGAVAYRLGRSFRHFGHSAPAQEVSVGTGGTAVGEAVNYCRSIGGSTLLGSGALGAHDLPLDAAVDDIATGGEVICTYVGGCRTPLQQSATWGGITYFLAGEEALPYGSTFYVEGVLLGAGALSQLLPPAYTTDVRTIAGISSRSLRLGSLTGPSTVLELDRALATSATAGADMRTFAIHEVTSPRLSLRAQPVDRDIATGRDLYFAGAADVAAQLAGRRLAIVPPAGEPVITVVAAVGVDSSGVAGLAGLHRVTLAADVAYESFPQEPGDAPTVVLGNLVDAEQGKSEPEAVLGSGDGRSAFQTFKLPAAPLTYLAAPDQTPPQAPALEVTVAGRAWTRVESLFGQSADAEVYIVREDDAGSSWVQFGDGLRFGSRLPSGVDNVRARFRTGAGAHGLQKDGTTVLAGRLDRLQAVQLAGVVAGGADRETADVARAAAPGRVQGLGRIVSLSDFETEALAMPGVALASAAWGIAHGVPAVTVTVLMESGREAEHAAVAAALRTAARERGPDRFEIEVVQGTLRRARLEAELAITAGYDAAAVLAAVREALGVSPAADGLFSLRRRRFGQDERATRVTGVIQDVPGVSWARVVRLGTTTRRILATRKLERDASCPPDQVLQLVDEPGWLTLATVAGDG
ncbi:MAG TPA: hypothetical protein VFM58_08535 [Solirubrobacteraceae bacterium]|nr:hypothetical protein [Solirubrobacteraceae bacterium]